MLKQCQPEQAALKYVQTVFEYLQGCKFYNLSSQPVPVLNHSKKLFSYVQTEFVPIPSCLSLGATEKSLAS